MKLKKLIFGGLLLPMVGLVACSDDMKDKNSGLPELDENGMATVSIDVTTQTASSRAAGVINISDADKIDVLVFEVYEVTGDATTGKTYTPLAFYKTVDSGFENMKLNASASAVAFTKHGKRLVFKVNPEKEYAVAFWAQNSGCQAYDVTKGLQNLTVSYEGLKNNDESRDAFCSSIEFSGQTRQLLTTILRRPFAQINVGTTGADYVASAKSVGGAYYSYSKVELTGVANTMNVMTDKIGGVLKDDSGNDQTVKFDWAPLAAWVNETGIPSSTATGTDLAPVVKTENEQFLEIDLDGDGDFKNYLTDYNTIKKGANGEIEYLTETFKYVSMTYVLVPSSVTTNEIDETDSSKGGSTLGSLKVSFANNNKGVEETAAVTGFTLTNVPVNRNWRTNILGGLYAPYRDPSDPDNPGPDDPENPDPDDPDNPDPDVPFDPSTIFSAVGVQVYLNQTYFGDHKPYTDLTKVEGPSNQETPGN